MSNAGKPSIVTSLPPVATVEQVAAYLHIGRSAAYESVRTPGGIPNVRIGKLIRIPRAALMEWLGQSDAAEKAGEAGSAAMSKEGRRDEGR